VLLSLVFAAELSVLAAGYRLSTRLDTAFHDGLGRGLEEYGRHPEATAAINDIQTTVRNFYHSGSLSTESSFQLHCCGVDGVADWRATPWGRGHGGGKLPPPFCRWAPGGVGRKGAAKHHQGR